ncbi:MAG: GNAT family N-acetyltransferase [Pseudomonadota bacterium]
MTAFHERPSSGPTARRARILQAILPVIETSRLRLRAPRIEDFEAFAGMVLGPGGRFFGHPKSREDAWGEFIQLTGTWLLRGHGVWAVTEKPDPAVIGFVQIGAEPGDNEPELGYIFAPEVQGRGLATEAAMAARDQALGPDALDRLVSYIHPENSASIALATRIGGHLDPIAEAAMCEDDDCVVVRHAGPTGSAP